MTDERTGHLRTTGNGTAATTPSTLEHPNRVATRSPWLMLAMATLGFAVNFWAWALISPLGPLLRTTGALGDLTESDVALLVAVPVIVGSPWNGSTGDLMFVPDARHALEANEDCAVLLTVGKRQI